MLTLDATLQTRMDGNTRQPLIDITAQACVAAIPFTGSLLTTETDNEKYPNMIVHSSGRTCTVYIFGPYGGHYYLKYVYSDVDRSYYTTASFDLGRNEITGVALCELADGNIGIVYIEDTGSNAWAVKQKIITVTGTAVSEATISTLSSLTYISGPALLKDAETDGYILVYTKISGTDYYAFKRTSSDFSTWAAEAQLSITGLTSTWKLADPYLAQVTGYDIFLWFTVTESVGINGEELTNIYYSLSTDGGANWGTATKVTSYTQYSEVGTHPVFVEKQANSGYLVFNKVQAALNADSETTGWPETSSIISDLHFDTTNRKLYVTNSYSITQSIVKIDVDTWSIDKYWTTATTPALHSVWNTVNLLLGVNQGSGKYVVLSAQSVLSFGNFIQVLDGTGDGAITTYAFDDYPAYEITANVTGFDDSYGSLRATFIDEENERIWCLFVYLYFGQTKLQIGYLNLGETSDTHAFTQVLTDTDVLLRELNGINIGLGDFKVYPDDDLIIVSARVLDATTERACLVYDLSAGTRLKKYRMTDYAEFPLKGLNSNFYYNGKIYGGVTYTALYGQENYRGLCEIDVNTDVIRYYRPSFASVDDYGLGDMIRTDENKLMIASSLYGVAVFDLNTATWDRYDNTTITGLSPGAVNNFSRIAYDAEADRILCSAGTSILEAWKGVLMFSTTGAFQQSQYSVATYDSGWSFATPDNMVIGLVDYDAAIVCDPASYGIIAFWVNRDGTEYSIKHDKDTGTFSLNSFIVAGKPVSISRSIDGNPNRLTLTLSHGHLFEPFNHNSAWRSVLDKGNILTVKFGETISGTPYYEDQGQFYIISKKLKYQRGDYPTIDIEAQDIRYIWKDLNIVATDNYEDTPSDILAELITDNTSLESGDLNIGVFDGSVEIETQWTNTPFLDICQQICDRFGYFLKVTHDNLISTGKISLANAVTHAYANANQILSYSPDDSFSDFTNRVVVTGQERDFSEILYEEERVASLNGTVGWWGFKKDYEVYYSDDGSRRCRYPRLVVIESSCSIGFALMGDIDEKLDKSQTDPNEKYCVVVVEAPNLVPQLIALLAAKLAAGEIGDSVVTVGFFASGGWTIPVGTMLSNTLSIAIMLTLSATGNFQYEIWAQPVGEIKRSVEGSANDADTQAKIGYVVEKRIEDPFCYTVSDCALLAQHELDVVTAQRKRIAIKKISHLQDEEGDTIRFVHPISNQNLDVFVTDITREYTVPEAGVSEEASCVDKIEGWVI